MIFLESDIQVNSTDSECWILFQFMSNFFGVFLLSLVMQNES
jgi:hypothetical protein